MGVAQSLSKWHLKKFVEEEMAEKIKEQAEFEEVELQDVRGACESSLPYL